jgi:hypothetical protein
MKAEFITPPSRQSAVKVGNVYSNATNPAKSFYRVVVGIVPPIHKMRPRRTPVVCVHVDKKGRICGSSNHAESYVRNCWDFVGRCQSMPTLKIEWLTEANS